MDRLIGGRILGGQSILLGIRGQDSRVTLIPACQDLTVTLRNHRAQEICGVVERNKP